MGIEDIKQDWQKVKQRYEAWWNHDLYDRPLIRVMAPRDRAEPVAPEEVEAEAQWTDIGYMIRRSLAAVNGTYYGGEAIPLFHQGWPGLSAGHTLYFGCQPHFGKDTVWVDPAPPGPDGFPNLDGWRDNPWWNWMRESTLAAAQGSRGRYFVPPSWGNHAGDVLALVRGTQALLLDLKDNRDWVKFAIERISDIQIEVFEELWKLVAPEITGLEGSANWCGAWSPGRTLLADCDVSCMICPQDFVEIFLPPLIETMRTVDHVAYHLDGPEAIKHLDALLDVPEVDAIQWVPGAGNEGALQWVPLLQRVQAKGKSIFIGATLEEVEPLLCTLKPEGLCIGAACRSESEARDLVDAVAKLSRCGRS